MSENYQMTKRSFVSTYIITVLLIVIGYLILQGGQTRQNHTVVVLTFIINILLFFLLLIHAIRKNSYSLNMMFWLFSFFFFGLAPLLQYHSAIYNWNLSPQSSEIIKTNLYILIFSVCYFLGYVVGEKTRIRTKTIEYKTKKSRLDILLLISFLITVFVIWKVGFKNLLSSRTSSFGESGTSMDLIMNHVLRNIPLFTVVMHILYCREKKRINIKTIIAFILFLVSCFPTSLSRNMMASFYGGLFIILFEKYRKKRWITYAIIFGLVLVFPAINVFRTFFESSHSNILDSMISSIKGAYTEAHYDAHQMFISIQQYVSKFGFSYGKQLLGVLLFFVPRNIWSGKPYGTGQTAFTALAQHEFTNVSAPLVSEGYVNFGIIGIIIVGLLAGFITSRLDKRYWSNETKRDALHIIYPFVVLKFFFMLRGDLLSSWAYTCAQIVVGYFIFVFSTKKSKPNKTLLSEE